MMNNDGRICKLNRSGKRMLQQNEDMNDYCCWHYCMQKYSGLLNSVGETSVIDSKIIDLNPSRHTKAFEREIADNPYIISLPDFITEDNVEEFINGNY